MILPCSVLCFIASSQRKPRLVNCRLPLVVSLLDGSVAAIDPISGKQLWIYATGSELVGNQGFATGPHGGKTTIFPGADGSLYAYYHRDESYEVCGLMSTHDVTILFTFTACCRSRRCWLLNLQLQNHMWHLHVITPVCVMRYTLHSSLILRLMRVLPTDERQTGLAVVCYPHSPFRGICLQLVVGCLGLLKSKGLPSLRWSDCLSLIDPGGHH